MIHSIDIPTFGSFQSFSWDDSVRDKGNNVVLFKRMNIVYGRNYSGKTTLSRIVRCLETGVLPPKFESPDFTIHATGGTVGPGSLDSSSLDVRVYNRDFVAEHLSFLTDADGQITPFAVIGRDNTEIEKKVTALEAQLGDVEEKRGLRFRLATAEEVFRTSKASLVQAERAFEKKLTAKATDKPHGIKHNPLFRDPNYNTPKIKQDIATVRERTDPLLSDEEKETRRRILSEAPRPDLSWSPDFNPGLSRLKVATHSLLAQAISPSVPIEDLLEDSDLQAWVKSGMPLHRGRRTTCAFCRQDLPGDLWKRLDAHFNQESMTLSSAIDEQLEAIKRERKAVRSIPDLELESLYQSLRPAAKEHLSAVTRSVQRYLKALDTLSDALLGRKRDLFHEQAAPAIHDPTSELQAGIAAVSALVLQHNQKTGSLAKDQDTASRELRLNAIAEFIADIDLEAEEKMLKAQREEVRKARSRMEGIQTEVSDISREARELRTHLTDESQGAERVNQYLNDYFGHEGLRLRSVGESGQQGARFEILRGEAPAYNLSEGECSLVAFCYFVARLEAADSIDKDLVIFIDDPVSSLDDNHIFFVYSLIESVIARRRRDAQGSVLLDAEGKPTYRYRQLFITTHNLDFLKYCKRLDRPKKDCEHFLVVAKDPGSAIELMPRYLREYVTEFNYLFHEIYICTDPDNQHTHPHSFYSFGNNLRKFLEAFLFFKYPFAKHGGRDHKVRVEQFFGSDSTAEPLVQRLTNEMSHLGERFDRSVQPVDYAEISKLASFVLKRMKDADKDQFQCLLDSISRPDPFSGQE